MSDPQFTKTTILRPFDGFADVYEGVSAATRPIMFTEGGTALDLDAGKTGYAAGLCRGISTPMGARALLWLPRVSPSGAATVAYDWTIFWRLRNVFDFRQRRIPYHYPKQGLGQPDTGSPRVVIPVGHHSMVYNQTEPAGNVTQSQHVVVERLGVLVGGDAGTGTEGLPLLPDGSIGTLQQGVLPMPSVFGQFPRKPAYTIHEVMCAGDELLIGVTRAAVSGESDWVFGVTDRELRLIFEGFPDVGVYLHVGTSF
jgi:hypothetical protein